MNHYFDKNGNEVDKDSDYYWRIYIDYFLGILNVTVHKGKPSPSFVGIYCFHHPKKENLAKKDRNRLKKILPEDIWSVVKSISFAKIL